MKYKAIASSLFTCLLGYEALASDELFAPHPFGRIQNIQVALGDYVRKNDHLMDIIWMKMNYVVRSLQNGYVENILVHVGQDINGPNMLLMRFTQAPKISELTDPLTSKTE